MPFKLSACDRLPETFIVASSSTQADSSISFDMSVSFDIRREGVCGADGRLLEPKPGKETGKKWPFFGNFEVAPGAHPVFGLTATENCHFCRKRRHRNHLKSERLCFERRKPAPHLPWLQSARRGRPEDPGWHEAGAAVICHDRRAPSDAVRGVRVDAVPNPMHWLDMRHRDCR